MSTSLQTCGWLLLCLLASLSCSFQHLSNILYRPAQDSFALLDAISSASHEWRDFPPRTILEVGCGSGYIVCSIALILKAHRQQAHILATDLNPKAVTTTLSTLAAHKVAGVDLLCTDLAKPLMARLHKTIDVLVFNPPYVPTPLEEVTQQGIAQSWAGGPSGRVVIDQFLPVVDDLLSPTGELFLATIAQNNPSGILQELEGYGFAGEIALERQADEEQLSILRCWRPKNNM